MKSFKFRLQVVLEQKKRQETVARVTYAEAALAEDRALTLLVELQDVKCALIEELSNAQSLGFNPTENQLYYEYLQVVTQSIRDQELHIKGLAQDREVMKICMVRATQDHKSLASMRDKHKHAHTQHENRKEQSTQDDMATLRHGYQRRIQGQQ